MLSIASFKKDAALNTGKITERLLLNVLFSGD